MIEAINKELAELLGIKPKYELCYVFRDSDYGGSFWNTETLYKKEQIDLYLKEYGNENVKYNLVIYPDFTQPENLLNLIEIGFKIFGRIEVNQGELPIKMTFTNVFLYALVENIKESQSLDITCVQDNLNEYKQAAQAVDWRY